MIIFLQSDSPTEPDSPMIVTGCLVAITFFKMAPFCTDIMNEDIRKFMYDVAWKKEQKKTKRANFLTF